MAFIVEKKRGNLHCSGEWRDVRHSPIITALGEFASLQNRRARCTLMQLRLCDEWERAAFRAQTARVTSQSVQNDWDAYCKFTFWTHEKCLRPVLVTITCVVLCMTLHLLPCINLRLGKTYWLLQHMGCSLWCHKRCYKLSQGGDDSPNQMLSPHFWVQGILSSPCFF